MYYTPPTIGLFVGALSFFVVGFWSFGNNLFCGGIFLPICFGAVAGWLTALYAKLGVWDKISKFGEKAGLVTGVFVLLGNLVGGYFPILMFKMAINLGLFPTIAINSIVEFQPAFSSFIIKGIFME